MIGGATGPLRVIHQDAQLIVVDKPAGIPVQGDRTGDPSLLDMVRTTGPTMEVGSPHRLDRPVSGLVVFTVGKEALRKMDLAFREHRVVKTYLAIVEGRPPMQGELVNRIGHHGGSRKAWVEPGAGTADITSVRLSYSLKAGGERYSVLEVQPEGGAFHQIRAQLAAAGHPIKGDVKYGARRGERDRSIGLHAWKLEFDHPATGERLQLSAPIPAHGTWPVFAALLQL